MVAYGFSCCILSGLGGSTYLLGSFIAGVAFSTIEVTKELWEAQIAPLRNVLLPLFFAYIGMCSKVNV